MKPWVRRSIGAGVGLLVALALLVAGGLAMSERKRQRHVDIALAPLAGTAGDAVAGSYLYRTRGCAHCHGADGAGQEFINDGNGMRVAGPNLTPGGSTARYSMADWDRVIRHGVNAEGRALMLMPSEDYNRLSDQDLAHLVTHLRTLPARAGGGATVELPLPVRVLYGLNLIEDAAQKIDHTLPNAAPVPVGITPEHGAYVANLCIGCHGPRLAGGPVAGGPPHWPPASNLTPGAGSVMPRYPNADAFMTMLRTGKRPDGSTISVMPFGALKEFNDVDVQALYLHLSRLAPLASGTR